VAARDLSSYLNLRAAQNFQGYSAFVSADLGQQAFDVDGDGFDADIRTKMSNFLANHVKDHPTWTVKSQNGSVSSKERVLDEFVDDYRLLCAEYGIYDKCSYDEVIVAYSATDGPLYMADLEGGTCAVCSALTWLPHIRFNSVCCVQM
jgi:hypothetical protein